MKRREFLAAGAGTFLPSTLVRAQQEPPLIGILRVNAKITEQFIEPFRRDMARLGAEEGKQYRTEILFADGDNDRLPTLAAELVKRQPKMILAFGYSGVAAVQRATRDIPIVAMADDLVAAGLVASMARPGGNTTGVSIMGHELNAKRLEMLHEIVPQARRMGVVIDDKNIMASDADRIEGAAAKLGLELTIVHAQAISEIAPALAKLQAAKVEAVQFLTSPFLNAARATFMAEMIKMRLPAMYEFPESVEEGGLVSYGPRITLCYLHVAVLAKKVLRGAKPADLPIEQPSVFVLAINSGAAHAIGLQIPEQILLRADVVVD
jgi:putative tryptophan/tyrosine transport system substrate-binding protein